MVGMEEVMEEVMVEVMEGGMVEEMVGETDKIFNSMWYTPMIY